MLTEADKEIRRERIGGSEVAAVLGIHPYQTQFDVFARLTMGITREDSPELFVGRFLESAVFDMYLSDMFDRGAFLALGQITHSPGVTVPHPTLPWLSATPDRVVSAGPEHAWLVECKTDRYRDSWGTPGTDQVPAYIAAQVQAQMAVTGLGTVDVPVLFKLSDEFAVFTVRRDEAVIDAILTQLAAWHARHIVGGEMPPLDGGSAAGEYLKRRFPGGGPMVQATPEQSALVREYASAKAAESAAKDASAVLRQRVIHALGDNDGFTLTESERCSYRPDRRGQRSLRLSGFRGGEG